MSALTGQEIADKWKRNLTASIPAIKAGVLAVTQSPMAKAAQKPDAYLEGVRRAVESGKWAEGLNSVSLAEWQNRTANAGTERISRGAGDAVNKVAAFQTQLKPITDRIKSAVDAMPSGSLEDSIARSAAAIRMMSEFRFRKPRS